MAKKAKKKAVAAKKRPAKKTVKKKPVRKAAKKAGPKAVKPNTPEITLPVIGEITHFFPHVSAGVIKLSGALKVGDMVQVKGHTTDFKQSVDSMQIDHVTVAEGKKGDEIGLKVKDRVRIGDTVYRL